MLPIKDSQNEQWDLFENAATHSYARSVLEKNKNKDNLTIHDETPRRIMTKIEYVYFLFILIIKSCIFIVLMLYQQLMINSNQ
jgi:hypothetical protein